MNNDNRTTGTPENRERNGALSDRVQSLRLGNVGGGRAPSKLPWVLCFLLLASTVTFGVRAFSTKPPEGDKGPGGKDGPGGKQRASSEDVALQSKGYIIPAHQIQVSPQVGGRIENLYVTEGTQVDQGQILAQLEIVDYETDYKRAVAKHEAARRNYELVSASFPREVAKADAELKQAQASYDDVDERQKRAERVANTQSQDDLTRLRGEFNVARARVTAQEAGLRLAEAGKSKVDAARAELEAAKSELEKAIWRLEECTIRAPVSGTILIKKAELNNLVLPLSQQVAASVCEMADLSDLEVAIDVQERDVANVFIGQKCAVMPEAYQENKDFLEKHPNGYEGEVSRLMPTADRAKGAIPVRVKVTVARSEEGLYLKPDMGVIVSFKKQRGWWTWSRWVKDGAQDSKE